MIVCTRCGKENPDGTKFCLSCSGALPQIPMQSFVIPPEKVMDRFIQLKEAVDMLKNNDCTVDEFAEFLDNIAQTLANKENEIREIEIPEESYDDFADELEAGFSGIDLYNEGIAHMMMFLEDEDMEHLDYGLELVYQGNEKINEAMRINRENRRKLEEMNIDTSSTI